MAEAAEGGGDAQQNGGMWGPMLRMALVYFAIQSFMGRGRSPPPPPPPVFPAGGVAGGGAADMATGVVGGGGSVPGAVVPPAAVPALPLHNAWSPRQQFDLRVYITEAQAFSSFDDASALVWEERALGYGRDDSLLSSRERNVTLRPSSSVLGNETGLWAHVYLSKVGAWPDPAASGYRPLDTASAHHPLVRVVKRKKPKAVRNLLSGEPKANQSTAESADSNASAPDVEWVPHWKPALTISIVEDFTAYPPNGVPPQILPALRVPEAGRYLPVIFINEFWLMSERLVPLNESLAEADLQLELSFSVTTLMRWMLTEQMTQSLEQQSGMHGEETVEEMRRMFAETSPWLLALTAFVSMLHTLFDVLAFKNDISFWKNNKSMKGLSFRSMLLNLFFQTVIFLYLADNDTSWMILISNGVGLVIEVWKLRKAIKSISLRAPSPGSRLPSVNIVPADSYQLSETKIYDEEAMRYLSMAMYPLVVGYSVYSLAYDDHKSWYSWLLGSTVNFVYSFGFVLMTPQLFINYKLKSTAHMPWKTLMYKSLNTFIDDLFAFIIKMPTMHRLSCLRDDLVFFIYIYQRWKYGVDKKRANEFGQVGEGVPDGAPAEQAAAKAD